MNRFLRFFRVNRKVRKTVSHVVSGDTKREVIVSLTQEGVYWAHKLNGEIVEDRLYKSLT